MVTPDACVIEDANNSTDFKSEGHWKNQEKEKETAATELTIFPSNFIDGKK